VGVALLGVRVKKEKRLSASVSAPLLGVRVMKERGLSARALLKVCPSRQHKRSVGVALEGARASRGREEAGRASGSFS